MSTTFARADAAWVAEQLDVTGKVDLEELRTGMDVELEHGTRDPLTNVTDDDRLVTGKIALAHLREMPDYYTRLTAMEAVAEGKAVPAGRLNGKVAIVTGAARGIGAATARALAQEGGSVYLTDVLEDEGRALTDDLATADLTVAFRHLDVSDEGEWERAVRAAVKQFGALHVLVNNAGIGTFPDVEQETREGWDRLIAINQTGVWLGMKVAGPQIRDSGGGSIINLSSIFGAVGGFGGSIAYHASKGAVRLMTKTAALHWAGAGVRVNSVHPGFIDTPMIEQAKGGDVEQAILAATPLGRLGLAAEVASVIAFLASDDASYMTGSEVYVDGGWTAR